MKLKKNIPVMLGLALVLLLTIWVFVSQTAPLMSPVSARSVGCAVGPESQEAGSFDYNGCVLDGLTIANQKLLGLNNDEASKLSFEILLCLIEKGYKPLSEGIPIRDLADTYQCKAEAVNKLFGKTEGFVTDHFASTRASLYRGKCPEIGSTVIATFANNQFTGGHTASCTVVACAEDGSATLSCSESTESQIINGAPATWTAMVSSTGSVTTTPPTGLSGGHLIESTQVTFG